MCRSCLRFWCFIASMCCLILSAETAYAQIVNDTAAQVLNVRVPGTTVRFDLIKTPTGTLVDEDTEQRVESLLVLTTEVTWDLYDIFVYELDVSDESSSADVISRPSKPYVPPDRGFGHDGFPAIGMTRKAAEQFCAWLSLKLGVTVRLPAKHEWIYLAVGQSDNAYCCGVTAEELPDYAWFVSNSDHSTHPVAKKKPNQFGLFDIHGNAAEWVITETRRPYAMGGGYRDSAEETTARSSQRQMSSWNQSDPQIPKSQWWLADCSWVGFRFVIDATTKHKQILEELSNE